MLCMDSYYLKEESCQYLKRKKVIYIAIIICGCFGGIVDWLDCRLDKSRKIVAAYNKKTKVELFTAGQQTCVWVRNLF